jgi:hypothetical protein
MGLDLVCGFSVFAGNSQLANYWEKEFNHRGTEGTEANLYAKRCGEWIILFKNYFNKSLSTQLNSV